MTNNDKKIEVRNNYTGYYFGRITLYEERDCISYSLLWNHMSREGGFSLENIRIFKEKTEDAISEEELRKLKEGESIVKRVLYLNRETQGTESIELIFRRVE